MIKEGLKIIDMDKSLCPYESDLLLRMSLYKKKRAELLRGKDNLSDFANGHLYYGLHQTETGWVCREWAPNVEAASLVGDFNNWDGNANRMNKLPNGNWELYLDGKDALMENQKIKLRFWAQGRSFDRIPAYMNRVVQNETDGSFCGQVWSHGNQFKWTDGHFFKKHSLKKLLIYECHIGIASEEEKIETYRGFKENVLPRIKKDGYNCIQLMAIMEHPYYASFGYQVANFFAPSSRFGNPEELKDLINTAHKLGMGVFLDIVHSHSVKNANEGLSEFDGTDYQYFHSGILGQHSAWNTRLFNYGKNEVLHFLLSNVKYWIDEFHFDGFRFDGITSMLYHDHGLGESFDHYSKYFSMNTDTEAVTYLQLANELAHEVNPKCITIAEDMSGMPGMCIPINEGGIGFDYRLSMGVPDYWIKSMKIRDEDWRLGKMWYELTTRRPGEKNIGYSESHDQALVGDKTIMFWLADQEMYWHMRKEDDSPTIARAVKLHKMIRLVTSTLAGEGYLNFMGNEFGHPEWIDFPREGNGNSFKYARRQWSLVDNNELKYEYLNHFDNAMIALLTEYNIFNSVPKLIQIHEENKLLIYKRKPLLFIFNFHTWKTFSIDLPKAKKSYQIVLNTEAKEYGGTGEIYPVGAQLSQSIEIPPRSAVVLQ